MKRRVTKSLISSVTKIRAALMIRGVGASDINVSRRLSKEFGLKSYKPAKKTVIDTAHEGHTPVFAKKYLHYTQSQRDNVMFSNESTFRLFVEHTRHVRRPPGKRYNEKYTTRILPD